MVLLLIGVLSLKKDLDELQESNWMWSGIIRYILLILSPALISKFAAIILLSINVVYTLIEDGWEDKTAVFIMGFLVLVNITYCILDLSLDVLNEYSIIFGIYLVISVLSAFYTIPKALDT